MACDFALQVLKGRWFTVFASFIIMAGAGATYLFGAYSKDIKSSLGYDQSTLNTLGFFKDLGANVGVLAGLIGEVTPSWFVLLVGSGLNFAGYFMIWLAVTGKIAKPKLWQMCLYICIVANSQNFANTGALVTCVKNFPEGRGIMLGLLKGYTGLSGAIFTQIYLAIYPNDSKSLILLVGWLPAALSVIFVYTIRPLKAVRQTNDLRVFYHFLYISLGLGVFLMIMTLLEKTITFTQAGYAITTTVVCMFMFMPLGIAIREELVVWNLKKKDANSPVEVSIENITDSDHKILESPAKSSISQEQNTKASTTTNVPCCGNICNKPERGDDYGILQALLSMDMIILFLATFCGLGSSLTAIDNLGQIGEALGYPTKTVKTFVSLVSIWNYFGRVFAGFVSETLMVKFKFPRTLMMTIMLLLSCVAYTCIAFPFPGSLYMASVMIGVSFGAQLTLLFTIVSELFGLKHYSTLFNCAQLASPIGSYVLNVKVTGMLYDNEALKDLARKGMTRSSVKELICIGIQCYRLSFLILAGLTFFGALVSLVLVIRTKEFYKSDTYKRYREEDS